MRKLFTSLLLLGAVTVTQAQNVNPVSVTSFEEGVLTVNYSDRLGTVTEQNVNQAIHQWRDTQFADVQGGPAEKDKAMREAVHTLKLTGDWTNHDLKKDQKIIFNMIEKLGEQQVGVGLDLSECQKMECKYVSVIERYDDIEMDGEVTFTYTPVGSSQTFSNPVTITPHANEVHEAIIYKVWGAICDPYSDPAVFPESTLSNNPVEYIQVDGKWYIKFAAGWTAEIQEQLAYSYEDENGETVTVDANTINNNPDKFQTVNGVLCYCYTTYDYIDKYGTPISTVHKHDPYNLKENRDEQGNLYYTYEYTITTDGFSFDGYVSQLSSVIFPNHANFTFIPNNLLQSSNSLTSITLPASLRAIGNHAFASATKLTQVDFPDNLEEIGGGAFEATRITSVDLSNTKVTVVRWCTFMKNPALETVTFPAALTLIEYNAFQEDKKLQYVDLSQCHKLRLISVGAFGDCCDKNAGTGIKWVEICSHPKILRGNGHGTGCFNNDKLIERVEIKACYTPDDPITDITQCYCEIGAFDYDITEVQTQMESVPTACLLVFPNDMPVGNAQTYAGLSHEGGQTFTDEDGNTHTTFGIENGTPYTNPYTSAFDFFVGDYKAGIMLTQSNLQVFHDDVPNNLGPAAGYGRPVNQPDLGQIVPGVSQSNTDKVVGDTRYAYNGWLEFIHHGHSEIVPPGEFLRTYSRTAGDGPCLLPKEIQAYRAVDYASTKLGFVENKNGNFYKTTEIVVDPETGAETEKVVYIEIKDNTDPADYEGKMRYSKLTIGGTLYLRRLVAKLANLKDNAGMTIPYDDENRDWYDSEEIYNGKNTDGTNVLENVPGGISYVPENTGVVLYSVGLDESALLILGGNFGTDYVFKEFPHTYDRYELGRRGITDPTDPNSYDDINMLQGSYGTGWKVAPVYPWKYKTESAPNAEEVYCSGGHFPNNKPKEYRNFACYTTVATVTNADNTTTTTKTYGWKRLQPSVLKVNRAFAQIPVGRFDNFNEGVDQMPDFTIEDEPENYTDNPEQPTFTNLTLLSVFDDYEIGEGAVVDGIKTVNTVEVKADSDAWYTLQGIRISKPTTSGVYIYNGRKVVIQ